MEEDSKAEKLLKKAAWYLQAGNFYAFCVEVLDRDLVIQPHQEMCSVAEHLAETFRKYYEEGHTPSVGEKIHYLCLSPRGTFKSSIWNQCLGIWLALKYPNIRILIDSETVTKSEVFLGDIRDQFEANQKLIAMYGKQDNQDKWNNSMLLLNTRTRTGLKEATFMTSGVSKSLPGMHYDLIIGDDYVSDQNVGTFEQIEKVINHIRRAKSLLDPGAPHFILGTRWTFDDPYNYILKNLGKSHHFYIRSCGGKFDGDKPLYFPSRLNDAFLETLMDEQKAYIFSCNPAEAPILMADLTTKRIEDVKVGDMVMGWSWDSPTKGNGFGDPDKTYHRKRMVPTEVTEINSRMSDVQTVVLDNSDVLRCTPDHHWFTGASPHQSHTDGRPEYRPSKVGVKMLKMFDTYVPDMDPADAGWLAGMFDGEGSVTAKGNGVLRIAQSKQHNPDVCKKIEELLTKYDYDWSYTDAGTSYYITGGWREKRRFMLQTNPVRSYKIVNSILPLVGNAILEKPKVTSITKTSNEKVYALTTKTGNYVVWGYLSRNCQYRNHPVPEGEQTFDVQKYGVIDKEKFLHMLKGVPYRWYYLVDPAITESQTRKGDYTAMSPYVITPDGKKYLYRAKAVKEGPDKIIDTIYNHYVSVQSDLGPSHNGSAYIETVAFQKLMITMLKKKQEEFSVKIHWKEMKPESSTNKEMRIRGAVPHLECGDLVIVAEAGQTVDTLTGTNQILIEQAAHFPLSNNDDLIDNQGYAVHICKKPSADEEPLIKRPWDYQMGVQSKGKSDRLLLSAHKPAEEDGSHEVPYDSAEYEWDKF